MNKELERLTLIPKQQPLKVYGGAQAIIKDTTILDADGSLGPKSVLSTLAMFNPLFSSLVTMDHPICYLSNNKSDGTSDQQGRSNKLNG
jgi:hypothetical protein